jgi:hypothetical protein
LTEGGLTGPGKTHLPFGEDIIHRSSIITWGVNGVYNCLLVWRFRTE